MSMCTSFKNNLWKRSNQIKSGRNNFILASYNSKIKKEREREREIIVLLVCGDLFAAGDRTKDDSNGGSMTKLTRDDNHTATELTENINHKAIELKENMNLQLQ